MRVQKGKFSPTIKTGGVGMEGNGGRREKRVDGRLCVFEQVTRGEEIRGKKSDIC